MPRNILLTVLRSDLRLSDNLLFHLAQEQTPPPSAFPKKSNQFRKEVTHLLPIYIYDQRQIEVGGLPGLVKGGKKEEARTRTAGFWRCGEHRTR
jgi:deoxyribodipyrimidine photo-lyase